MSVLFEVILIASGLALALVVITRVLTDPKKIKEIKDEIAFYKKKISQAQKEGNQKEVKRYTSMMISTSKKQFKSSMKSMMVSMVVVLVAFYFLGTSYHAVDPGLQEGNKGTFSFRGIEEPVELKNDSYIFGNQEYPNDAIFQKGGVNWKFDLNSKTFIMLIAEAPFNIPFLGKYLTWFWLYIIITLPVTLISRKILGVES